MGKNLLVISCAIGETRVALIENGIIAELHIERSGALPRGGSVGDIYLGKVTRVLPGLQAAFVDIGLERAAFLHVEDLIRPDDFETYLAGGRKHALGAGGGSSETSSADTPDESDVAAAEAAEGEAEQAEARPAAEGTNGASGVVAEPAAGRFAAEPSEGDEAGEPAVEPPAELDEDRGDEDAEGMIHENDRDDEAEPDRREGDREERSEGDHAEPEEPDAQAAVDSSNELEADDEPEGEEETPPPADSGFLEDAPTATELDDPASDPAPAPDTALAAAAPPLEPLDELLDDPNLPGFTVSEPGEPMPRAPAPRLARRDDRGGGDRRGRRRRGRGRDRGDRSDRGDRGRGGREADRPNREHRPRQTINPGRLSKSTPIREVVKEGQEIIVQITKEPISTKGARCSSHISLPGRYVVYLPTLEHVGVSKRIGSDKERARLRETIESMRPPTGGLIVRTVAEGLTKKQLKQDVGYLVRLWGEVAKNREVARAPKNLLSELDIVLKTARDLFTDDVDQIVIDDKAQYERLCRFVEMFMPERLKDVVYFNEDEPIFDAYGIEDEIARALSRKVPLPSGGYLILDEAEALTAIDVNTGRYVGKGSKDMEETILKTNLEAVHEIAYQLRFRNIGGLIILDLIDMEKAANREKVRKTLEEILQRDKAKTTLNRISELGLIEMTRKRTRESLGRLLHEPCFYCDGTGHLQSKETIAFEILREIRRKRHDLPGYTVLVNCHPAVADMLTGSEKAVLQEAESRYMRRIQVTSRTEYHLEQFDLVGK